jgi:hypothetical protein
VGALDPAFMPHETPTALSIIAATPLAAQTPDATGRCRDASGTPIRGARVSTVAPPVADVVDQPLGARHELLAMGNALLEVS